MAPGSGDVVKPSGYGLMNIIRFAPTVRYKDSGASVCADNYLKPVVEEVNISAGLHTDSSSDLVGKIFENCWDYTAVQTTPTGHVVAGFDTLSKEVKAIGYNHFALNTGRSRNLFCTSVSSEAAARSAPYIAEFTIYSGRTCSSNDNNYGVPFYFRPADYGLGSGWYTVAVMVDEGYANSPRVCPWRNKHSNNCELMSDIYIDANTNQYFTVSWETSNCFTNLKARVYQCSQQTVSTRGDPEEVVRSLNAGDSPNLGWFSSLPGNYSRFWLDWQFKTNFNGGIMTRVYRGRNYYGWDERRIINNRNNFTFTKRDFGSSDSWVDQSWSGDMGDDYNYFSFTADKTKEYRFYWRSFGAGGGFFAPVSGFGPASVSEDGYLPFKRAPISGTVAGNVYQDLENACASITEAVVDSWDVRCKPSSLGDEAYVLAQKTGGSYTCVNSSGGFEFNSDNTPYVTVQIVPADGWLVNTCAAAAETYVVPVLATTNEVSPFYIWQGEGGPWVKTFDGDVAAAGNLSVNLPEGEYLSGISAADYPGVVSYGGGSADLGNGSASTEGWLVESGLTPKGRTFTGFKTLLGNPTVEDNYPGLSSLSSGLYHYSQDITIDNNLNSGQKVILLVDGSVTINSNLTVANGDFLAVIASGNITFASDVAQAQGIFFAEGQISTGDSDSQFFGEGMFLTTADFVFGRDLSASGNEQPAEVFTFRPDLLINSPTSLWLSPQTWTEVAP